MRRVIDGKLYNAETAEHIAHRRNCFNYGDFQQCEEDLYRTKNGRYFLVGSGGPMSKYKLQTGNNSWSDNRDVFIALSESEALEWCQDHEVDVDIIMKYFGDDVDEG